MPDESAVDANRGRASYSLLNGLRVRYLTWEPEGNGQPLFLLHGLASNARIWEKVAPYLAAAGLRVLAPDLRGHGQTDKPDDGYDFESLTRDLMSAVDGWNAPSPVLVGHSWGASLALAYAARFPMGPLAPRGVVLVDGALARLAEGQDSSWEEVRERLKPPQLAGMPVEDFLKRVQRGQLGWQPDEQDLQIILANFAVSDDETISPQLTLANHLNILHAMWEMDTWSHLARINCPLLAVLAQPAEPDGDEWYRRKLDGAEKARQANPNLEVLWLKNTIHDIPLQRPVELAGIIESFVHSFP